MKEKLKKSNILDKWFYTDSPLVIARPALRETGICLLHLLLGCLLSCGTISGQASPFALGFLSTVGGGLRGLCTLIGAVAGYLTRQSFAQGLQMTSSAILVFMTMYIFSALWVARQRWFICLVPGIMSTIIGGIFLFSQELTPLLFAGFFQTVLLSALSPLAFSALMEGKKRKPGSLIALGCFLFGAGTIGFPYGMSLGSIAAATLLAAAVRHGELGSASGSALICGIALDLSCGSGGFWCFLLSAGAIAGCGFPKKNPLLRLLGMAAGVCAAGLLMGKAQPLLSLIPGILLSLLIPEGLITAPDACSEGVLLAQQQLQQGAAALSSLYKSLGNDPELELKQTRQQVLDKAAGKICKRCSRYHACWTKNTQETYRAFHQAMDGISLRGQALREDFPEHFSLDCRHMDGLLRSINQELDTIAMDARNRSRTEELKHITGRLLLHLSKILEENRRLLSTNGRLPSEAFTAKVGVSAAGRSGSRLSGDRGLSFQTEDGRFFAILCDGAGTGMDAARESLLAADTLAGLIRSGMPAANAMELLNGVYILRDEGAFSTMDVLELSLITGQATLLKWGSAPSFLRSGDALKKIGSAAPPPGLGVGSNFGPEVIRLSLWGGDMLVLLSDGALCRDTEDVLHRFEGDSVKSLATSLMEAATHSGGEDDMTVAVIRLETIRS